MFVEHRINEQLAAAITGQRMGAEGAFPTYLARAQLDESAVAPLRAAGHVDERTVLKLRPARRQIRLGDDGAAARHAGRIALRHDPAAVGQGHRLGGDQFDAPVHFPYAVGLDEARLVDHLSEQAHLSRIRDQIFEIRGVPGGRLHFYEEAAPVRTIAQIGARAGRERDVALGALDDAGVLDVVREQVSAERSGRDLPLVPHHAPERSFGEAEMRGRASEPVEPRQKIRVGHVQRRGDQPADVHLGVAAEQDAVRVEQNDGARGVQHAVDHAGVGVEDPIERDSAHRLQKARHFIRRDVELPPVDDGV